MSLSAGVTSLAGLRLHCWCSLPAPDHDCAVAELASPGSCSPPRLTHRAAVCVCVAGGNGAAGTQAALVPGSRKTMFPPGRHPAPGGSSWGQQSRGPWPWEGSQLLSVGSEPGPDVPPRSPSAPIPLTAATVPGKYRAHLPAAHCLLYASPQERQPHHVGTLRASGTAHPQHVKWPTVQKVPNDYLLTEQMTQLRGKHLPAPSRNEGLWVSTSRALKVLPR